MGSETSDSCLTDTSYSLGPFTGGSTWPGTGGQACAAIGAMASNANTFYSDATSGCKATNTSKFTTITGAGSIFQAISANLQNSRLIPGGDT
jgi:hypothetical protein